MFRRKYLRREEMSDNQYGRTLGCKRCETANRGSNGIHNETCRLRVEKAMSIKEPDRFNEVFVKLVDPEEKSENESLENRAGE